MQRCPQPRSFHYSSVHSFPCHEDKSSHCIAFPPLFGSMINVFQQSPTTTCTFPFNERSKPGTSLFNVERSDHQQLLFGYRAGFSTSLLSAKRMINYPPPPRTQSRATSVSASSAPSSPSERLVYLEARFPSTLSDTLGAQSVPRYSRAIIAGNWSYPLVMDSNSQDEKSSLNLCLPGPNTLQVASLDGVGFLPASIVPSSTMSTQRTAMDSGAFLTIKLLP